MNNYDIDLFDGFHALTKTQRKKLFTRIINDVNAMTYEQCQERVQHIDARFSYLSYYLTKAMHEVQKSGYEYTLMDF